MNTAVEYFHSLVEDHFTRDQYEVSFNEGKYNVVLAITHQKNSPMSYYVCLMRQRRMEKCVEGLIRPENFKLQVIIPTTLKKENSIPYHERIDKILKLKNQMEDGNRETV
jgi:hypothetical protein